MKKTAINQTHHELGAKMVEFAGYEMPVIYSGITTEHEAVRNRAGIFDVSHMGEFFVNGPEAADLVQYITSNNSKKLKVGQAQYSCLPNHNGGIVDDLIVYRLKDDPNGDKSYMLVVNASNIEKDWKWINDNNSFNAQLQDRSDEHSLFAVQGPNALAWLQELTDVELDKIPYYSFEVGRLGIAKDVILSNTGYTGSGGFEIYVHNDQAQACWDALMDLADKYQAIPCGLGARDTLRLEMGFCLYGNDLSDTTSPIEAGLSWIVKTKIKSDFIAKAIFSKQKEEGVSRKLVGFNVDSRRVPRKDYNIFAADQETKIGVVSSGTMSPTLEKPIGMGYVDMAHSAIGQEVWIEMGRKKHLAVISRPPFVTLG